MRSLLFLVAVVCTIVVGADSTSLSSTVRVFDPSGHTATQGFVTFVQERDSDIVYWAGEITGLKDGEHGFHVHQYGNLTDGCTSMGGHFNPDNEVHGAPTDRQRHVGDLGNIVSVGGRAVLKGYDTRISLTNAKYSIVKLGVVVHADPDDLGRGGFPDSKTTGHAGPRVACGIVGSPVYM